MKTNKLSPAEYRKFIKGLELKELKVVFTKASVKETFKPPAQIHIKADSEYKKLKNKKIKVLQKYKLECLKKGKDKPGFLVEIHYNILYSTEILITDEIFKIFSQTSVRLHTWPYFRQFVHQMTMLMNLPPLVLDTIKIFT